jgi:DNA-binding transcriptional ArsR family regulator
MRGIWEGLYRDEFAARLPMLREAALLAEPSAEHGFGLAFAELTGNRLPAPLVSELTDVECVTFCPSYHLGGFVSFILYPPDLVIFYGAPQLVARRGKSRDGHPATAATGPSPATDRLGTEAVLDALRALADANRLRILELLGESELYAQEIVGRLGIAQSAVSRHLSLLERAGLLRVRPRGGMKYYAVDQDRLARVADAIRSRGRG